MKLLLRQKPKQIIINISHRVIVQIFNARIDIRKFLLACKKLLDFQISNQEQINMTSNRGFTKSSLRLF